MKKLILFFIPILLLFNCGSDDVLKDLEKAQYYLDNPKVSYSDLGYSSKSDYDALTDEQKDEEQIAYNALQSKTILDEYFDIDENSADYGKMTDKGADRDLNTRRLIVVTYAESVMGTINITLTSMLSTFLGTGSEGSGGQTDFQIFEGILPDDIASDENYETNSNNIDLAQNVVNQFMTLESISATDSYFKGKFTSIDDTLTTGEQTEITILYAFLAWASFTIITKRFSEKGDLTFDEAMDFINSLGNAAEYLGASGFAEEAGFSSVTDALKELEGADEAEVEAFLEEKLGITST